MESRFRRLTAYRLAIELADELHMAIGQWDSFDRWSLGMQLMRAVDSVGANIAEAAGRFHVPDRRRLLVIARGSLYETEHWVSRAHARGLLKSETDARLSECARALNGLIKRPAPD
jgi:four helix bundle protein